MPPIIIAGAALAVAAVGTYASIKSQKKMVKEQRKAARFERQKNELQEMRQKTEAVRATRTALAQSQQRGENQGVAESSVAKGAQGSIFSQGGANLSFLDQYGFLTDQAGNALDRAMKFQSKASMWAGVSDLALKVASTAGGIPTGGGGGGGRTTGPTPPRLNSGDSPWWIGPGPG